MSTEIDEKRAKTEKARTIGNAGDVQSLGLMKTGRAATRSRPGRGERGRGVGGGGWRGRRGGEVRGRSDEEG